MSSSTTLDGVMTATSAAFTVADAVDPPWQPANMMTPITIRVSNNMFCYIFPSPLVFIFQNSNLTLSVVNDCLLTIFVYILSDNRSANIRKNVPQKFGCPFSSLEYNDGHSTQL